MSGMDRYDLLVLGDANIDLIIRSQDPTPVFGQEKLVDDLTLALGGSASIFACQAAKLGLRTTLASIVGDDEFAHLVLRTLAEQGVGTGYMRRLPGRKTGATLSLTTARDRALLTYEGTISALEAAMITPEWLALARHVHVASYFLQPRLVDGLADLLASARRAGATVSLDTGWDPTGKWDGNLQAVLAHVDLFLPNESEAMHIAGCDTVEKALARLGARIPVVAIKLGAAGAIAERGGEVAQAPALQIEVVDTTGRATALTPDSCTATCMACRSPSAWRSVYSAVACRPAPRGAQRRSLPWLR